MKVLVAVSSSLFVAGAIADATLNHPTLVTRDLTMITDAVNSVNSATASLYYIIKGPKDDINLDVFNDRGVTLLSAIHHGTALVKKSSDISLSDAITLQGAVGSFSATVNQTMKQLISSRSAIAHACKICDDIGPTAELYKAVPRGLVYSIAQQLDDLKTAYISLSQVMVAKVPSSAQSRLSQTLASITDSIQQGIVAFSTANNTNNNTSSSSSASISTSSASSVSFSSAANSTATTVPPNTTVATTSSDATTSEGSSSAAASPAASAATNVVVGGVGIFALVAAAIMLQSLAVCLYQSQPSKL